MKKEHLGSNLDDFLREEGFLEILEVTEDEWLRAAARNPAFRDLAGPEEDIYSLEDGEPFQQDKKPNLNKL